MNARLLVRICALASFLAFPGASAWSQATNFDSAISEPAPGLRHATVLIIRHAEKPDSGYGLTPEGFKRAQAYVDYFQHFKLGSEALKLDWLVAANDSKASHRPRLTLEPLSNALGLHLDLRFKSKQADELAQEMRGGAHGKEVLICWHHGQIPNLLRALGARPEALLPDGKWPADVFNWVIELRFDDQGRLIPGQARRIQENLLPGDAVDHSSQP